MASMSLFFPIKSETLRNGSCLTVGTPMIPNLFARSFQRVLLVLIAKTPLGQENCPELCL